MKACAVALSCCSLETESKKLSNIGAHKNANTICGVPYDNDIVYYTPTPYSNFFDPAFWLTLVVLVASPGKELGYGLGFRV